ncbi:hypothetical protein LPJ79_002745 [Coemansia sp. RSA 1821]|nr:hypothetical protein LPJ79_002745 [Coemansia sp. RSA 1821]
MAVISSLPDDIILDIFGICTSDAYSCLEEWKRVLSVLAVCRRWRALAAPMVYCTAIIGNGPVIESSYAKDDEFPPDTREKCNYSSNIDLVIANGYGWLVEHVVTTQMPVQCYLQPLRYIKRMLCTHASQLTGVRVLNMSFCLTMANIGLDTADHEHRPEAAQIARDIATSLPFVDSVFLRSMLESDILLSFAKTLANIYFGQLKEFEWTIPGNIGSECTSAKLERCNLRHANNEQNLPLICPRQLERLFIAPFSESFSWRCFHFDKTVNTVAFDNLQSLVLSGRRAGISVEDDRPVSLVNSQPLELMFPRLVHLKINHVAVTEKTMAMFIGSPLKVIDIDGPIDNMEALQMLKLRSLDALHVSTWFGFPVSDNEFYQKSNVMFQNMDLAKLETTLAVNIDGNQLDPAHLYWPYLTILRLCSEYVDEFGLNLVPQLPNLVHLTVYAFSAGEEESDEASLQSMFSPLLARYSERLHSKITSVRLAFSQDRLQLFDALVTRLFQQCLPELSSFKITN